MTACLGTAARGKFRKIVAGLGQAHPGNAVDPDLIIDGGYPHRGVAHERELQVVVSAAVILSGDIDVSYTARQAVGSAFECP